MELKEIPIFSIEDLHFTYNCNRDEILKGVSFNINKGERVAILGSNGAGKTTIFNLMTALLKGYSGSIKLQGLELAHISRHDIAQVLSFVPQKHEPLFPFSVKDFILMGRYAKIGVFGNPTKDDLEAVENAAVETGAIKFFERPYNQLSGGEIQLTVIARALAQETEVLILDEPSNHLDFKNQFMILNLVKDIAAQKRKTLIMSLHNPNDVLQYCDRAIVLDKGKVAAEGQVSEIVNQKLLKEVFGINTICIENGECKAFLPHSLENKTSFVAQ